MFKTAWKVIVFLVKTYIVILLFGLPFTFAWVLWHPEAHVSNEKKYNEQGVEIKKNLGYFEAKGWFPGNEMFKCYTRSECRRLQENALMGWNTSAVGVNQAMKCRGKWYYLWKDLPLYQKCDLSVFRLTGMYCKTHEPFCIRPSDGKVLWNTKYDPDNPTRLVDESVYVPMYDILPEEETYIMELARMRDKKFPDWGGYKSVEPGTIWIDPEVNSGIRLREDGKTKTYLPH